MPSHIERKLAAIMFTDIAGYTEQMSKSESKSLDTLEKKRSILKPLLDEYKVTFVKEIRRWQSILLRNRLQSSPRKSLSDGCSS